MGDLFSGNPDVKEGLERIGWSRVPFGQALGGYSWKDADGNLYTEVEAQAAWERYQKEERRG